VQGRWIPNFLWGAFLVRVQGVWGWYCTPASERRNGVFRDRRRGGYAAGTRTPMLEALWGKSLGAYGGARGADSRRPKSFLCMNWCPWVGSINWPVARCWMWVVDRPRRDARI